MTRPKTASSAAAATGSNPLLIADWVRHRQAARFLARLRRAVLPIALMLLACGAWAKAASITATLEPAEIAFGESAQLTVNVQGQDESPPQIPAVSGLSFQPLGQSSQIQIINGAMSANLSHTYAVTPSRPGAFTIPPIKAGGGRAAAASEPIVFTVLKTVSPASRQNGLRQSQSVLPAPAIEGDDASVSASERDSIGFLRITAPKQEFFVGELVPVELKACFRAGVELRVDGLPRLNSEAFTMNKLGDHPQRSQQTIGGIPYTVFTWSTAITAVKAGDYEMSVGIPTTVTVRQRAPRPRARSGGPFGDSLFDEFFNDSFFQGFFGTATQKEIELSSQPTAVKILSLPSENRPASFAGAVGKFDVAAEATPTHAAAGDPVTIKFKVTGSGNFDRVTAPVFEANNSWKTYKPSSKFEPEDSAGYAGTKTFEQAWVPARAGQLEIPALRLSYFDPEKKEYATRTTNPMQIQVGTGQGVSAAVPASPGAAPGASASSPAASTTNRLAPDLAVSAIKPARLRPWVTNPWFVAGSVLPSLAMLASFPLIRRQQRLSHDPHRLQVEETHRVVQTQLKVMERAAEQGEAANFLIAARGALQHQLGLRWGMPPQEINLNEVNVRMNAGAEGFRFVFEIADEVAYTGLRIPAADLRQWSGIVTTEIKRLEEK